MLPVAQRIVPEGVTWNEMIVEQRRQEQLEEQRQRQQDRGFSR
ncbi:hypothetical protein [Nodularia spumigena]|nr:hypothetical protein [Nodularia spumigena]